MRNADWGMQYYLRAFRIQQSAFRNPKFYKGVMYEMGRRCETGG